MTPRDERPTNPPAADDTAADAFASSCRENEWAARLENIARLRERHGSGRLEE